MTIRKKKAVVGAAITIVVFVACLDSRAPTAPALSGAMAAHSTAPFGCQVEFTEVTSIDDDLAMAFGVGTNTDTSYVCAAWTGSDYRVFTEQLGSSVPLEMRSVVTAASYDNGVVTTTAGGNADPQPVGSSAFDMGLATPTEIQASYEAPFYGVYGGGGGGGGGGGDPFCDPNVEQCDPIYETALRSRRDLTAEGRAAVAEMRANPAPHGLHRRGLRRLTADMDELAPNSKGHRRFRKVNKNEETIIEIDPATELLMAQEINTGSEKSRAEFSWKQTGKGHVRERMKIDHTEHVKGKPVRSVVTVSIVNFKIGGR